MKRQIIYRLTEILSFYAFLRPALCESGKGKFISGTADFGVAAQHSVVMAFITDSNY